MTATYDPDVLKQEAQLAAMRKEFMTVPAELILELIEAARQGDEAEADLSEARANIKDLEWECQNLTDMLAETEAEDLS